MVHPTGNTYVRQDLQALYEAGRLATYVTGLGYGQGNPLANLPAPGGLRDELRRRAYALPPNLIQAHPARDSVRLLASKLGITLLTKHEDGWASVDAVFHAVDRAGAAEITKRNNESGAVLAYEDGALFSFKAAQQKNWRCIYHLPIAYGPAARKIFEDESVRLPDWAPTLQGDRDSPAKMERKKMELTLADVVICPSRFVLDSIPEAARINKSCHVVRYGAPVFSASTADAIRDKNPNTPLRLLFAGALSQRKGLADVFEALRILGCPKDIELVLLGRPCAPMEFYRKQPMPFTYEPPRPNSAVLDLMATCDALILPSLVEGRAIVQLEALSRGLPLLVTPNTGGEDLVIEGETGFTLPIRSPEKLAEKIEWLRAHRGELPAMRAACREMAIKATWQGYRASLLAVLAAI